MLLLKILMLRSIYNLEIIRFMWLPTGWTRTMMSICRFTEQNWPAWGEYTIKRTPILLLRDCSSTLWDKAQKQRKALLTNIPILTKQEGSSRLHALTQLLSQPGIQKTLERLRVRVYFCWTRGTDTISTHQRLNQRLLKSNGRSIWNHRKNTLGYSQPNNQSTKAHWGLWDSSDSYD